MLDEDYTAECVAKVVWARDRAAARLRAAGITVLESATNCLFVRAAQEDAAPVQQALRERGILVRHFDAPERITDYCRITIGSLEQMTELVDAVRQLLEE